MNAAKLLTALVALLLTLVGCDAEEPADLVEEVRVDMEDAPQAEGQCPGWITDAEGNCVAEWGRMPSCTEIALDIEEKCGVPSFDNFGDAYDACVDSVIPDTKEEACGGACPVENETVMFGEEFHNWWDLWQAQVDQTTSIDSETRAYAMHACSVLDDLLL